MCKRGKLEKKQPNLFLIGAMRCGTTSLHLLLGQHPDILMSPVKEPMFYAAEAMRRNSEESEKPDAHMINRLNEFNNWGKYRQPDAYSTLFEQAKYERYLGESSHYLYHPLVAPVIHEDCPEARIIVSLRNPVERLYSEYLLNRRVGRTRKFFNEFVLEGCKLDCTGKLAEIGQSRITKGFYYRALCEWMRVFGRDQIKVVLYEDFAQNPVRVCQSIFTWLSVDPMFIPVQVHSQPGGVPKTSLLYRLDTSAVIKPAKRQLKKLLPKITRHRLRSLIYQHLTTRPDMDPTIRNWLTEIYREDIENVEKFLGLDLASWK